ncbi:MAG: transcription termination/antitermination protein NusA [Deltaproteobacteria bacterium]|nr:transcription termination/antitermination protein NusA [Deltaproteobacteria bacterium]
MISDLTKILEQVSREKGVERDVLIDALEEAVRTAARKKLGNNYDLEINYNDELGEIEIFGFKEVVKEVSNENLEISLEDSHDIDPDAEIGDSLGIKMDTDELGRIAAQSAKQVIMQRLREAERNVVFDDFKDRKGEIIHGIVQRFDKGSIIVNLGRAEAELPSKEQIPKETYRQGDRVRAYLFDVKQFSRGPQVILSRTHPNFLSALFENEVPEISEGIVRIIQVSREPGSRAKIAVTSKDADVDPVGACVGMKGSRVQAVVQELRGEKIDIVTWDPDPAKYICNALAPAEIIRVIVDESNQSMEVVVADDQLSLAIGRKGQNVRLASKISGWRLDVTSESDYNNALKGIYTELLSLDGVGEATATGLFQAGFRSIADIADAAVEELIQIKGISEEKASILIKNSLNYSEREVIPDEIEVTAESITDKNTEDDPSAVEKNSGVAIKIDDTEANKVSEQKKESEETQGNRTE